MKEIALRYSVMQKDQAWILKKNLGMGLDIKFYLKIITSPSNTKINHELFNRIKINKDYLQIVLQIALDLIQTKIATKALNKTHRLLLKILTRIKSMIDLHF